MTLYVIGEDISAGQPVICSAIDGKLYAVGKHVAGEYIGDTIEGLREGFRARLDGDEVREDDA